MRLRVVLASKVHYYLPIFKAPRGDDPEQNAGTILASNPEHLPVFKALCRDNPE